MLLPIAKTTKLNHITLQCFTTEATVLCKSNANTCRRNSTKFLAFRRILDRNETSTTFLRIFEACIVLNGSNFRRHIPWWRKCDSKFRAKIRCNCSFFQKKFGWICGSVLLYVKLPWNFPLRFESSAWPMLFATMATLSVSIVSMRLGSFTYSTFGSHRGQSFKLNNHRVMSGQFIES